MPRNKNVKIGDNVILVEEKRVGELEEMVGKILSAQLFKNDSPTVDEIKTTIIGGLFNVIRDIAPELKDEDVKNAYPSELEALVEAFIEVNFTGVKKVFGPLSGLFKTGLTQQSLSSSAAN